MLVTSWVHGRNRWPLRSDVSFGRTRTDQLIAICSTTNKFAPLSLVTPATSPQRS